jgi:GNAT superfamily N-acetyltransferase
MTGADPNPLIRVVPANEASWADLQAIFGTRGDPARCQCQHYRVPAAEWRSVSIEDRAFRLRDQTDCGHPESDDTSGLVAYYDGEPAGWCAVSPRIDHARLLTMRHTWLGRNEDPADTGVWSVTCFVVRAGFRKRGISRALTAATVDFARTRGARALEGYSMITTPGKEITWGELHVGARNSYAAAGFREVVQPSSRRVVMRIDFAEPH